MPTTAEKAKAKLEAVLNDPQRHAFSSHQPNRIAPTHYPAGGCELTNFVSRRSSQSSQGSEHTVVQKRTWVKRVLSLPAY
ncbi:hypothetical protein ESCO_000509 [Escovopsis weberi]|uniref:Uncharacterized protein n=1 Tax=Escovopsis weberi TaxID=150374 RepID=A0A0M8MUZ6_ESCWE|nr:hypothetical protein ESCO_000509 [Escovopsis weberi]